MVLFHCSLWRWTTSRYRRWRRWLKTYTLLGCVSLPLIIRHAIFFPFQPLACNTHTHTHCRRSLLKSLWPIFPCYPNIKSTGVEADGGLQNTKPVHVAFGSEERSASVVEGWAVQRRGGVGIIHRQVFLRWPHRAHVGSGVCEWGPLLWDRAA